MSAAAPPTSSTPATPVTPVTPAAPATPAPTTAPTAPDSYAKSIPSIREFFENLDNGSGAFVRLIPVFEEQQIEVSDIMDITWEMYRDLGVLVGQVIRIKKAAAIYVQDG
jgi:hypothetical protein